MTWSLLVMAMIRTAIHFQKLLTLSRYVSQLEARRNIQILHVDKDCLQKFISLVQAHFDLTKCGAGNQNESLESEQKKVTIYDLFEMIKTGGVSSLGLKKTLLTELEEQQTIYCKKLVHDFKVEHNIGSIKINKNCHGLNPLLSHCQPHRWCLTLSLEQFKSNVGVFRDF
jgi:hypothetical protein